MAAPTLDSITLHPRMAWVDEYTENQVVFDLEYTLDGTPIVQYGKRRGGVPITLKGGAATRTTLQELHALQALMKVCTLTLQDGRSFSVIFAGKNAIVPTAIGEYHDVSMVLYYELELKLIQVNM